MYYINYEEACFVFSKDRTTDRCSRNDESLLDGTDLDLMNIAADTLGVKVSLIIDIIMALTMNELIGSIVRTNYLVMYGVITE